jgi:hypothetical protein
VLQESQEDAILDYRQCLSISNDLAKKLSIEAGSQLHGVLLLSSKNHDLIYGIAFGGSRFISEWSLLLDLRGKEHKIKGELFSTYPLTFVNKTAS